jgi:acetylornithine aminotransferase/acetylornithine/N-succinyldiaminopimelate aminotransferase
MLIFDEIQCGLGRSGRMWGWQRSGVVPDAVTVAKALAGGLPIGVLIAGPQMATVFEPGDHGTTFGGGPVQCAAGLAVLDVIDDPALLGSVRELGERLVASLTELPGVTEVRGRGFMGGADLNTNAPALATRALTEQRLVLNATGPQTIRFLPPLIAGQADVDEALSRFAELLS